MKLGIIGGSGLYGIDHFNVRNSGFVETPFGTTQSQLLEGDLNGNEVVSRPARSPSPGRAA